MTDWEFVFDGVVGFLTCPMWNVPIVTFIEKNCIVFKPGDENELTYTEIHKEYSSLVEDLLTSYLSDVGITEEQFLMACQAGCNGNRGPRAADQSIFEQVWAGEDFEIFKQLMVQKNIDLQIQALHMIQQRNGDCPKAFISEKGKSSSKNSRSRQQTDDDSVMTEAVKRSNEDYEKEKGKRKEIERIEKSLAKEEIERLNELAEQQLNVYEKEVELSLKREKLKATKLSLEAEERSRREKQETCEAKKKSKETSDSKAKSSPPKSKGKPAEAKSAEKPSTKKTSKTDPSPTKPSAPKQKTEASSSSNKKTEVVKSGVEPTNQKSGKNEVHKSLQSSGAVQTKSSPKERRTAAPVEQLKPTPVKAEVSSAEAASNWMLSAKAEFGTTSNKSLTDSKTGESTATEDEIKERQRHFQAQRDKLMKFKQEERMKQLEKFAQQEKRPTSARVARDRTQKSVAETPVRIDAEANEKKLRISRALAAKLKKEVVNASFENNSNV